MPLPSPQRPRSSRSAVALVIVLAFVVLLTGLLVAFFSLSVTERQVSNSSANQTRAELLAGGAADAIIGDLKQEIAAGSNMSTPAPTPMPPAAPTPTPAPQPNLYTPLAPLNATVAQVGVYSGYPNVLKRSVYNSLFYPASGYPNASASNRAANVSTLTASLDNRLISPGRWNKALLLPKANIASNTDYTPVGATGATAAAAASWTIAGTDYSPNWILVARDGTNPTTFSTNLVFSAGNSSSVTGRYAYMIYNEGGLLDANVAGYPIGTAPGSAPMYTSTSSDPRGAYKGLQAFADLTQLPGINALSIARQQGVINSLVGWRNYASAQPSGSLSAGGAGFDFTTGSPTTALLSFTNAMLGNTTGFLTTNNVAVFHNQTDRLFSSRQELIGLLLQGIAAQPPNAVAVAEQANLQTALQYLGTFSRDLNQPSYAPNPSRPITPSYPASGPGSDPAITGSNTADGNDKLINPSFLAARVVTGVAGGRNDGSNLIAGEPVVKKRFALNRLAWLTYVGPIAVASGGTASYNTNVPTSMINALKNTYGYTDAFLLQGTAANVYKYFGLIWAADTRTTPEPGDSQSKWVYNHSTVAMPASYAQTTTGVPMLRLSDGSTADVAHAGREADFFELLKAALVVGSKAKTANLAGITKPGGYSSTLELPEVIQNGLDSTLEYAVIQVGANIIDQFDLDGFPTRILYNSPAYPSLTREFAGVENLPYLYRIRAGIVQGRAPTGTPYTKSGSTLSLPGSLSDTGYNVLMDFPEIWNPHDANSPRCALTAPGGGPLLDNSGYPLYPTSFRLVADSIDPDHITNPPPSPNGYPSPLVDAVSFNNTGLDGFSGYQGNNNADYTYMSTNGVNMLPFASKTDLNAAAYYMYAESTALTFTLNEAATPAANDYFREPTMLMTANQPVGTMLRAGGSANMLNPGVPLASSHPSNHANIKSATYMDTTYGGIKCVDGNTYLGIYLATVPAMWDESYTNPDAPTGNQQTEVCLQGSIWDAAGNTQNDAMAATYRMEYDTSTRNNGVWATYDTKYLWSLNVHDAFETEPAPTYKQTPGTIFANAGSGSINFASAYDPRTSRFGMVSGVSGSYLDCPGAPGVPPTTAAAPVGWLDSSGSGPSQTVYTKVLATDRKDYSSGSSLANAGELSSPSLSPSAAGFNQADTSFFGLLSQNNPAFTPNGLLYVGGGASGSATPYYYSDPDGVVRRAMGAYVPNGATNSTGLPLATANTYSSSAISENSQLQSRPIVLNRPFQSVTELGEVFSGTPWKNLDFFTPESGDSVLLDVFTVNDSADANGMVAGKVDLNTRQQPVLQAIVAGAYKDEQTINYTNAAPPAWKAAALSTAEAAAIAQALQTRTANSAAAANLGPLGNVVELVGRYINSGYTDPFVPAGSTYSYDGFSNDLTGIWKVGGSNPSLTTNNIQRLRSAPIRALAAAGETRVWNLMIDVIAQTGRYPANANSLANFAVEGEQRYWVHVAIDRLTGQVIDKQIEIVKE